MINEFSLNNAIQMKQWDDFVASHPEGTAFHLTGWINRSMKPMVWNRSYMFFKMATGNFAAWHPLS